MSEAIFKLAAEIRDDMGKGASRRLRRLKNQVPAIIYGGNEKPQPITVCHDKVLQALRYEAFYSHILTLELDGKKERAVLKDIQRHPFKPTVLHIDFLRVKGSDMITMTVPIHYMNEDKCPGVKEGGVINRHFVNVEVRCKASDLPEYLEIDVGNLQLDQAVHLTEIKLPAGVELTALSHGDENHDSAAVSVHKTRVAKADTDADEAAAAAEAEAESKPEEGEEKK